MQYLANTNLINNSAVKIYKDGLNQSKTIGINKMIIFITIFKK